MSGKHHTAALLAIAVTIGLGARSLSGWAQEALNRITALDVDTAGNIIVSVDGEGVDPLVRLEPAPHHQYRIVIQGKGATLEPGLLNDNAALLARFRQAVPAVDAVQVSMDTQNPDQFQVVLTSWQKLQPQIKSNTGPRIVIALIGNHALPAEVVKQRQRAAELKRQQELAKQAEAARQAAILKQQEEARKRQEAMQQKLALLKKQQAELKRKQAEQAALKKKQEEEAALKKAEAAKKLAETLRQKAEAEQARHLAAAQNQKAPTKAAPGATLAFGQLQTDWTPAYRPEQTPLADEAVAQLQLATDAPHRVTPRMLALDKFPTDMTKPSTPDTPTEPIRLTAPPAGLGTVLHPNAATTDASPATRILEVESLYALLSGTHANSSIQKAWQDLQNGNATNAELGLRSYLEKAPDDAPARYLLGLILLRPALESGTPTASPDANPDIAARRNAARQEFQKAIAQKPYWPAYDALLQLALEDDNLQEASRLYQEAASRFPHTAPVYDLQGRLQESLGFQDRARQAYLQALAIDSNLLEAHWHLAQLELSSGRLDAARWELDQALALAPSDGRLWKLLGFIAEKQHETAKAGLYYRAALQPDALINYGRSLEAQNQPDKALAIYKAVETLADDDIDLLFNLGMIYAAMKQDTRAEATLARFLELNKDTADQRIVQAKTTLKQISHKAGGRNYGLQPKILPF